MARCQGVSSLAPPVKHPSNPTVIVSISGTEPRIGHDFMPLDTIVMREPGHRFSFATYHSLPVSADASVRMPDYHTIRPDTIGARWRTGRTVTYASWEWGTANVDGQLVCVTSWPCVDSASVWS